MLKTLMFAFLILSNFLFSADSLYLKEQFKKAEPGDFVVLQQDRMVTLFFINAKIDGNLVIEEVSLPDSESEKIQKSHMSWRSWFQKGAPKNTSWVIYEVSLSSGQILNYYSFSRKCFLDPSRIENFLPTLLNLKFTKIPTEDRRRIGQAPIQGERDRRQLWQPRMIVDGKTIPNVVFNGWKAQWPKDSTPLSKTLIEIYLPTGNNEAPAYFPYWLQVSDMIAKAKLRIIDSGTHLTGIHAGIPAR